MQEFEAREQLQVEACAALANLAAGDAACKQGVADAMGAEAMCHAMGVHPDSDEVQQQGCRGLLNLSTGGSKCERAVMEAKGAKMAVTAMLRHPADPGVQWLGGPSSGKVATHPSLALGLIAVADGPAPSARFPGKWQAPHDSLPLAAICRLPCTRQSGVRPVGRASGGAVGFGG